MKLYSGPLSLFSAKVRIALAEKQLAYELISVPFTRAAGYSPKLPEMLAINPKGQVPVLIDAEVTVYDSTLILEYLEERYPEPPLFPRDIKDRVRCRQLEATADEIFFPMVWDLIAEGFYKPDAATRDLERIAKAQDAIHQHYAELNERLRGRDYLCERFSVADIGYFMTVLFASSLGAPVPADHNDLLAWQQRLFARPALAQEAQSMTLAAQQL